jgi:hypothetical protein
MTYDPRFTTTTPVPSDRWNCVCDMVTWPVPCPNHSRRRQTVSQPPETPVSCTCGYSGTTQLRHGQPHQTASQPSRHPMHPDPHTDPSSADSGDDSPISEPATTEVPEPLADAVAAVHLANRARERQQLIHDLAATDPIERGRGAWWLCHYCDQLDSRGHRDDCLWLRARQLTNQPDQP